MKLKTKFQDEDFELGEVVEGVIVECLGKHEEELRVIATAAKGGQHTFYYSSIKKFMGDWEDYEELKEYWYVSCAGRIEKATSDEDDYNEKHIAGHKQIANHFETKEEAEKAVEKLKAWKRLKDKGFKFKTWGWDDPSNNEYTIYFTLDSKSGDAVDLDLLFGDEE